MWLFTTFGFFSVVRKGPDPRMLCVRSRWRADLEDLRKRYIDLMPGMTPIETSTHTDYAFRFYVPQAEFAQVAAAIARDVTCANFKDAAHATRPGHASMLHGVWEVVWRSATTGMAGRWSRF